MHTLPKGRNHHDSLTHFKPHGVNNLFAAQFIRNLNHVVGKKIIMANTFSQMYVQLVFAVKNREYLITSAYKDLLEKYICGIIKNNTCKPLAIYCNPDHVHILVGLHPTVSVSDLTRDIKACSSKFINQNNWVQGLFRWQDGFGSFTYSRREMDSVVRYILNQAEHHKKKSFYEEYLAFLEEYEIDFDLRYVFDWNERPE